MKKSIKILSVLLILVFCLAFVVACNEPDGPTIDNSKYYDEITSTLTLTKSFEGKSFLTDGIGRATLISHTDGDTSRFRLEQGNIAVSVRYYQIDTPESTYEVDPWGKAASNFTSKILRNAREIILEAEGAEYDSYGRRLAYVWVDGILLNLYIVQEAYSNSTAPLSSKYGNIMMEVANEVRKTGRRFYGETDPDYKG